jgi:hypothetical protein
MSLQFITDTRVFLSRKLLRRVSVDGLRVSVTLSIKYKEGRFIERKIKAHTFENEECYDKYKEHFEEWVLHSYNGISNKVYKYPNDMVLNDWLAMREEKANNELVVDNEQQALPIEVDMIEVPAYIAAVCGCCASVNTIIRAVSIQLRDGVIDSTFNPQSIVGTWGSNKQRSYLWSYIRGMNSGDLIQLITLVAMDALQNKNKAITKESLNKWFTSRTAVKLGENVKASLISKGFSDDKKYYRNEGLTNVVVWHSYDPKRTSVIAENRKLQRSNQALKRKRDSDRHTVRYLQY